MILLLLSLICVVYGILLIIIIKKGNKSKYTYIPEYVKNNIKLFASLFTIVGLGGCFYNKNIFLNVLKNTSGVKPKQVNFGFRFY